ncbi:GNAT family N-acetyltransferase [Leifsonia sp. Root227]|uniref:GNAT family N-acetyltransferase n=1 Tax=Leifsonia sp. Root227 TaxID=1736496 RepID=UPI000A475204|nr:GNAT family N-acetyltransferase [Leifsonia sp. Root227]
MLPLPSPAELDDLADRGWPALEREALGPWTLRFADGVTNRANSVLPSGRADAAAVPDLVAVAEQAYRRRGLPTVFQVSPATDAALPAELAARGYREHSATRILVADRATIAAASVAVDIASLPSEPWMELWWSVDGRGDRAAQAVAERILAGVQALYAASGPAERPDAVARLAVVDGWGGLFSVATRPEARRRGHAATLIRAVADAAAVRGVERLWLQVMADNTAAVALYERLGFVQASGYSYWTGSAL